jgi:hypothetical protein
MRLKVSSVFSHHTRCTPAELRIRTFCIDNGRIPQCLCCDVVVPICAWLVFAFSRSSTKPGFDFGQCSVIVSHVILAHLHVPRRQFNWRVTL